MQGLISIIIPVYNHAHTLKKCLTTAVESARHYPIELIVVNDGSTDNFHEVFASIITEFSNIKALKPLVINQPNLGAPVARNRGFEKAKGEYVIFMDADTVCYPEMFNEMMLSLQSHPEASYSYSRFRFGWKTMKSHSFDKELLKKINYIDVTSLIRSKDFIFFDESLKRFQDWDLWLSMLERHKTGIFVPKILYKKIVGKRKGISNWLPSFVYNLPWKIKEVKNYEEARGLIVRKHALK